MRQLKLTITLIIFICLTANLTAQNSDNYIEYYNLVNEAKALNAQKLYDSCLTTYQNAFSKVEYVHNENLRNAAKVCKKLGEKEQKTTYLERAKSQEKSINYTHKSYINCLLKQDQKVRTPKFMKARDFCWHVMRDTTFMPNPKKYAKSKKLMETWSTTDSMVIELLKQFIAEYGFPGEKMVGSSANSFATIMILHYDKDTANHIMGETLKKALLDGNIAPDRYAWIIDRHLNHTGKPQIYHSIPFRNQNFTKEEREIINSNRESIGLKKLEEVKIIYRKNSVTVY